MSYTEIQADFSRKFRLEQAVETAESVLAATRRKMAHADKARMVSIIYDLIGEGTGRANAMRVVQLVDAVTNTQASSLSPDM